MSLCVHGSISHSTTPTATQVSRMAAHRPPSKASRKKKYDMRYISLLTRMR